MTPSALRALNLRPGVKGVQIVELAQDSPVAGMNIEPGAIILSINGKATPDIEAFNLAAPIRARNGFWLAIPSPDAMKMRGPRGQRPTPASSR